MQIAYVQQTRIFMNFKILLVDVEGTTTEISFVKQVLFPYILQNLESYLEEEFENIRDLLKDLESLSKEYDGFYIDVKTKSSTISTTVAFVQELMAMDKKVAPLKNLQGVMWKSAYEKGLVKGHVFDDVVDCLKRCKDASKPVYIYSSGSVFAQKLLFKYSAHGDLSSYFSGNYDTVNAGLKTETESYMRIFNDLAKDHNLASPSEILFLTDNINGEFTFNPECRAASKAGFKVINLKREGNADISSQDLNGLKQIESFESV